MVWSKCVYTPGRPLRSKPVVGRLRCYSKYTKRPIPDGIGLFVCRVHQTLHSTVWPMRQSCVHSGQQDAQGGGEKCVARVSTNARTLGAS
jgi:hypothetical protein